MLPARPTSSPDSFPDTLDLRTLYHLLRERAWLIASCVLLAGLATAAYLARAPRIYAAHAVVQVEQEEQKILKVEGVQQERLQTLEALKTVEQTLQSRALLARVLDSNNLAADPRFVTAAARGLPLPKPRPASDTHSAAQPPSRQELLDRLAQMVQVRLRRGTRLIDIKVEHPAPALTALIANSLVDQFMRQGQELNANATRQANEFLLGEAARLKRKLEASEHALQTYREQTQSASLEDRQNVVAQKLKELGARVTEAKSHRIQQETAWLQVQRAGTNLADLLVIPAVANHTAVLEIRSQIARLESEIANLKQRYREKHPKLIQAQSQLAEWHRSLHNTVLELPQTIRSSYESAKVAEAALEQALREQEAAALELSKQAIRYNVLLRDVETDRAMYQAVLTRIKETDVTKEMKPSAVRIIQSATVPERPAKPHKLRLALLGLVAGLSLGVGLALLLNAWDNSLKTVDQTEEYLQLPVLSTVPRFSGGFKNQIKLLLEDAAHSAEAESFRTLRTALSMLGRKQDRRTFLFTSALPAEGKTFCSINYALSLAQQGLRTLLIDADLRRPAVEKVLSQDNQHKPGLTDYLAGHKTFTEVVHPSHHESLHYLPAGTDAPNPAELLAQVGLDSLLEQALAAYDRVVLDSAPIHAVSDTLLIAGRVQTVCLVVRAGKTPRHAIRRAVQLLREAEAPLGGVILNLMPRRRTGYGYYYYHSYYDYAYGGQRHRSSDRQDPASWSHKQRAHAA